MTTRSGAQMTALSKLTLALVCVSISHGAFASTSERVSPKAYVVAEIRVTDPEGYREYLTAISPVVAKHGGTYIARAGRTLPVEGTPPAGRVIIIEFPTFAAAEAFENSAEAQAAFEIRHRTATSRIFVVEGSQVEPPRP